MCAMDFAKGVGAGMAMGLALGMMVKPRKRKYSGSVSHLLKLMGKAVDQLGDTIGF